MRRTNNDIYHHIQELTLENERLKKESKKLRADNSELRAENKTVTQTHRES